MKHRTGGGAAPRDAKRTSPRRLALQARSLRTRAYLNVDMSNTQRTAAPHVRRHPSASNGHSVRAKDVRATLLPPSYTPLFCRTAYTTVHTRGSQRRRSISCARRQRPFLSLLCAGSRVRACTKRDNELRSVSSTCSDR